MAAPGWTATLSADGRYRYTLSRAIVPRLGMGQFAAGPVLFVMLNPSIADASIDDQTVRRCRYFATREGGTRLDVVNLYAYRARLPRDLVAMHAGGLDVTGGPEADRAIEDLAGSARLVIAAWGNRPARMPADVHAARIEAVRVLAGGVFHCLGVTADGNPRHPSRLGNDAVLSRWHP